MPLSSRVSTLMRGLAILGAWMLSPSLARADVIQHFNTGTAPGQFPTVSTLLDAVGIGQNNVASETIATSFQVPGSGPVNLTFRVEIDGGFFFYEFGFVDTSLVTAHPITNQQAFAVQALTQAVSIFNDLVDDPGSTRTVQASGGQNLMFFIVPNNTIANFLANPSAFYNPFTFDNVFVNGRRAPLFSLADANPGEFDQLLSFIGNGKTLFTYEDLSRAGPTDNSFIDLGFTADAQLVPVAIPEPTTLVLGCSGSLLLLVYGRRGRRAAG